MPWATNGQISTDSIDGGVEITDEKYHKLLEGILAGKIVQVADGVVSLVDPPPPSERTTYWIAPAEKHQTETGEEPPADAVLTPPPDDYHTIDGGQWVYSLERERDMMVVTAYQARSALLAAGLLDDVETLMADPETARDIVLMWQHKPRLRRTHPTTVDMAMALGMTDTQLDDLFRAAMLIEP